MSRYILTLLCIYVLTLEARENPFNPVNTQGHQPLSKPIPTPDFAKDPTPLSVKIPTCQIAQKPVQKSKVKPEKETSVWKKVKLPLTRKPLQPIKVIKKVKKRYLHAKKRVHHKAKFILVYKNDNLKIYAKSNQIKIITSDQHYKTLHLKQPNRLVLDFGDDFVIYDSIEKTLHTRYFKKLKIGTHPCYYRVTFVLKKPLHTRIRDKSWGYLITLLP